MSRKQQLVFEYAITAIVMVVVIALFAYFLVLGPGGPDVPFRTL